MPTRLQRHDAPGNIHFLTISCYWRLPFFGRPEIRDLVVTCVSESRDRLRFRWLGYVVMPEHVHWIILPEAVGSGKLLAISSVIQSLKTSIGMRVKAELRRVWVVEGTLGTSALDRWATSTSKAKPIWMTRGVDFNITTSQRFMQKLDYCHKNPVTRRAG